jgi:Calx-beta domain
MAPTDAAPPPEIFVKAQASRPCGTRDALKVVTKKRVSPMRLGASVLLLLFLVVALPVPGLAQDPTLGFSVAASSGGEDSPFDMAVVLTTSDGSATSAPVTVDFRTIAGTALAGLDFLASSGSLTFPTGTASGTSQPITVSVVADDLNEATETFTVGLSDATGASIGASSTFTRTIVDADAEPTISIADLSVAEGQSGMQNAIFEVSLSAASGQDVTVTYATVEGTASGTSDFAPVTSTLLTIPAGATSAPLSVSVLGDTAPETDETFVVNLTAPSHATLGDATATGTILDDDTPGSFEFSLDDFRVTEGASEATITVTRTGGRAGDTTVGFDVMDATAKSGVDFAPTTGTLTFGFDTTSQTFVIPLMGDSLSGATRAALLRLRSPSTGATLGTRATAALTILDDDQAGRVQFGKVAFLGS